MAKVEKVAAGSYKVIKDGKVIARILHDNHRVLPPWCYTAGGWGIFEGKEYFWTLKEAKAYAESQ